MKIHLFVGCIIKLFIDAVFEIGYWYRVHLQNWKKKEEEEEKKTRSNRCLTLYSGAEIVLHCACQPIVFNT